MDNLALKLKMRRIEKSIPQWKMAKLIGIHQSVLSRIENQRIDKSSVKGYEEIIEKIKDILSWKSWSSS